MMPGGERQDEAMADEAHLAKLRYVSDREPGLLRVSQAEGFRYLQPSGEPVTDPADLARIEALRIPPAWTDVWISSRANGHLQATGRDARRRKQYRYHARWRSVRDDTKFRRMVDFGEALPLIRERIQQDLARPGLPRAKVLAAVVALLDMTHIRIGNEEYAQENRTYGLTTLRNEHARVRGSAVRIEFVGKAGKPHLVDVRDRRLARIIKRCQELAGQELFCYLAEGEPHSIRSEDVNDYLRDLSMNDFTAKDFRTWAGTVVAACSLWEAGMAESEPLARKQVVSAIQAAARHLGNTPAVCKKSYVHPLVLTAYLDGTLFHGGAEPDAASSASALRREEARVLSFLRQVTPAQSRDRDAA